MPRPDLIRLTSAARTVGVHVGTLARLVQTGSVPLTLVRLGGTRYLQAEPFATWREAYMRTANPAPAKPAEPAPPLVAKSALPAEAATGDAFSAWQRTFHMTSEPSGNPAPTDRQTRPTLTLKRTAA